MKRTIGALCILIIFFIVSGCNKLNDNELNIDLNASIFGGSLDDYLLSIISDNDGNFVAVGGTKSNDGDITDGNKGKSDGLIIKFDKEGNKIWDRTLGGSDYDGFRDITQDSDGNYIVVGHSSSTDGDITNKNKGKNDALIVKIDKNGTLIWNKTLGGTFDEYYNSIIEDENGDYIAVGYTNSNDGDITDGNNSQEYYDGFKSDALIVKYSKDGMKIWDKTFGGSSFDIFSSIISDNEDNYILVGDTNSDDGDIMEKEGKSYESFIIKIGSNGEKIITKTFSKNGSDSYRTIIQDSDGNFVIVGGRDIDKSKTNHDILIMKLDIHLGVVWDKTYGGNKAEYLFSIIEDREGYYYVAGETWEYDNFFSDYKSDILICIIDKNGDKIIQRKINGTGTDRLLSIIESKDGKIFAVGHTGSNDIVPNSDIYEMNSGLIVKVEK